MIRTAFEVVGKLNLLFLVIALFISAKLTAGSPVWTLVPLTATSFSVLSNETATVQYLVTNHSNRTHTLIMTPINGVVQITSPGNCSAVFTLEPKQSCILSLQIGGTPLTTNINGGPQLCQEGNRLQCYQPSRLNSLNITKSSPTNGYAYITNANGNSLVRCEIALTSGALINCVVSAAFGLDGPFGISINSTSRIAYIANLNSNSVTLCRLGTTGDIESCIDSGATGLVSPRGINLSPNNAFIYIANDNTVLTKCTVNSTSGLLENCVNSGANLINRPRGIAFNVSGTRAYIVNFAGSARVVACNVNLSTGSLSGCVNAGAPVQPFYGIVLNSSNTIAYLGSPATNNLTQCTINAITGLLSSCIATAASGLDGPLFISLDNAIIYLPNANNNTISQCPIGGFANCTISNGNGLLDEPAGIAIN